MIHIFMFGNYLRLVKFSHTLFSLPFALASFFLAWHSGDGSLSWRLLVLVILAVIFARNAAMGFNRYIDRKFDLANPRTRQREIPAGVVSPMAALLFVGANALLFVLVAWFINPLCFALSPVALLVILGYSLTKRFTALCHLILGIGLALAPLGAWLAVTAAFSLPPLLISMAVLLWVSGFDVIYALQDEEFDQEIRLRSIPAALGRKGALLLSAGLHAGSVGALVAASSAFHFSYVGWTGTVVFAILILYQHLIISPRNISRINLAFFTTNGIASLIWGGLVIADIFFRQ
jgi:4-hydroxybenzoate polyprenyltransferase